jgi:isopenicillin N synthase-like dioxygenase
LRNNQPCQDFGSITILWSQPVSALQILSPDGKWRWVKHIDNALVCPLSFPSLSLFVNPSSHTFKVINAGDCLEFLSGSYYKATIHRVVQPPPDQRSYNRLGVFYFCIPDDELRLDPLMDSQLLQHVGIEDRFKNTEPPVVKEWRMARTAAYGQSELKSGEQPGTEEEVIKGMVVKHYN